MKVHELIRLLERCPKNLDVVLAERNFDTALVYDIDLLNVWFANRVDHTLFNIEAEGEIPNENVVREVVILYPK